MEKGQCGEKIFDDHEIVFDENILDVDQANGSDDEENVDDPSSQNVHMSADQKGFYGSPVAFNTVISSIHVNDLEANADEVYKAYPQCDGSIYLSSDPPVDVADKCEIGSIRKLNWHSKLDLREVFIQSFYFGRKLRGRLQTETQLFEDSLRDDHIKEFKGLKMLKAKMPASTVLCQLK